MQQGVLRTTDTLESIGETSGESRTERIRRLNRERQRRRREKLRMSRQSEAPSTTGNDVDPSHDLELLSEGCAIVEVTLPLKVETEIPEELRIKQLPRLQDRKDRRERGTKYRDEKRPWSKLHRTLCLQQTTPFRHHVTTITRNLMALRKKAPFSSLLAR